MNYGTDNVISIYNTENRMHFDHAVCVIRAGEIGMFDFIETSKKLKKKKEREKDGRR